MIVLEVNEMSSENHLASTSSRGSRAATRETKSQWLPSETEDASVTHNYVDSETLD